MKKLAIGVDIGGTHVTAGIVDLNKHKLIEDTIFRIDTDSAGDLSSILASWVTVIQQCLATTKENVAGIGIAMPGPFDYEIGISEILGVGKYESLFGLNVRYALADRLKITQPHYIRFMNDAHCFLAGEAWQEDVPDQNIIGLTLGTGFGSAFWKNNRIVVSGEGVPPGGFFYNQPFRNARAENYFNTNWFIHRYSELSDQHLDNVKTLAQLAMHDNNALRVFHEFAGSLDEFLAGYISDFKADKLIIGGSISRSANLFKDVLSRELSARNIQTTIQISTLGEQAALIGAARLVDDEFYTRQSHIYKSHHSVISLDENHEDGRLQTNSWRKSQQFLAPVNHTIMSKGAYDIYPSFPVGAGKIRQGIAGLVDELLTYDQIIIDGYTGVYWQVLAEQLYTEFSKRNISVCIFHVKSAMKPEQVISEMIEPWMGKSDSIFGKRTDLQLMDFFDQQKLAGIKPTRDAKINILLGCGAALADWEGALVYADLPKNELQFRMRAASIENLGSTQACDPQLMYKRFYFVDWVVLNEHKRKIFPQMDLVIDAQRPNTLLYTHANTVREALKAMSHNFFRVRPWFEPGPWGGTWIKDNITGLASDVPNYAWSFELIVPENGLMLESNDKLLEISFDFLMFQEYESVLGKAAERFGVEFPIRFDFLDTFDGGNLSIQCHPRPDYMKHEFGENFTQDECYYILDSKNNARVFLGFQEGIEPDRLRNDLEISFRNALPVDIDQYVQSHPVQKHDLLLIPNGTIHGSGINNLVLEISSTPYIFTFKMYDWLRMDLNGKPRPINIDHAFNNLYFERRGERVKRELIARPEVIASGEDWQIVHLKTHPDHFYDVERLDFVSSIEIETNNRCHVCMLVEGGSVMLETRNGMRQRFNYAETFVIPAAAISYRLINETNSEVQVVKAFVK